MPKEVINPRVEQALEEQEQALTGLPIGSKKLLRVLNVLKITDTIVVPPGDTEILIETLGQSQFAFYEWDVVCQDDALIDVWITAGIVGGTVGGGVQCALLKRRNFKSPDKIDVILFISNSVGGDTTLAYKVYRKAGLD